MTSKGSWNQSHSLEATVSKCDGVAAEHVLSNYLHCVFPEPEQTKIASSRKTLNFENLPQHISQLLSTGLESSQSQRDGRLGPSRVVMDRSNGFEGLLIVDEDLLGVIGHSNFSSIRSSTCVYKGRWMYEVMLSSQGLMQIGWCTLECRFNQEEGVGDTPNSYAYDGSRVRKWNVTTTNYGKPWAAGDIVTCLLDLDEGTCSFFLNGVALGTAFSDVRLGSKMAYFPAVSLSFRENVVFNFGGRPLRYPVEGYQPLQDPPFADLLQAQKLMGYLKSAMTMTVNPHEVRSVPVRGDVNVFLAISHIFAHLTPLLVHSYLVDAVLLRFLLTANAEPESSVLIPYFLDLAWVLMEDFEVENSLKQLMMSLLREFRFSPLSPDMGEQVCHLQLLLVILQHDKSRRFLLNSVLFDAMRFPAFFNVKLPVRVDEAGLEQMIPVTWWGKQTRGDEHESPEHCGRRQAYENSCHHLTKHIQVLEDLQVAVLKLLLNNTDGGQDISSGGRIRMKFGGQGESTRDVFLRKFRKFLEENISSASPTVLCPPEYLLCFLHRLTRTLHEIWLDGATAMPEHMPLEDAYVPPQVFYNEGLSYFELQRLGGLIKHLRKIHKDDLQCLGIETVPDRDLATMDDLVDDVDRPVQAARSSQPMRHTWSPHLMGLMVGVRAQGGITVIEPRAIGMNLGPRRSTSPASASQPLISLPRTSSQKETHICTDWQSLLRGSPTLESTCPHVDGSLLALLDGLLLLYHIGAHQQLGKMVGVAEDVKEYALALTETEAKISRCPLEQCDVMKELQRSENVFRDKLNQLSRRLAWHNAAIYSSEKMGDIYWLLRIALGSVEHADRSGPFFAFLPEFYVSVSVNAYNALKSYFTGVETLPGFEGTLIRLATVLARHFVDPRIVGTDIKDLLMQALASFVCFPSSLHALEEVPDSIRMSMLRSLLAPYEQRPWAQTNWILVRLWKGSGFGYRYTHLIPPLRLKPSDANNPTLQKPCPSLRLQQQAATLLQQRSKQASAFLNSLINQLNWAFSEFVGMIQEIQQTAERPERNIVDSRQLKVCATCFDLSVSLLRVLEMTAHLVPSTLSDPTSPASDLLLARLSQLLNQILHRITAEGGLFDRMVSFRLPVLEQVDHYPILAAVTGTLIQLIVLGTPECRERATAALLADPGFQLRCICCLLGEGDGARKDPTNVGASTRFSFRKHPSYVNAEELQMVEQLVSHLSVESTHAAASTVPTSEEDLCPICCAHCISAVFQPCGHKSCKTCIQQHLMNNKECFFCKTVISTVNDFTVPPSS